MKTPSPFRDCTNNRDQSTTMILRKSNDSEWFIQCNRSNATSSKRKGRSTERRKAIQKRRTHKERNLRQTQVFNGGPWTKKEKRDFLRGLRQFGPGKWKKIQTILTTRSNIQIKSHGQKILGRMKNGEDVYFDLDRAETEEENPSTPQKPEAKSEQGDEDDNHSTASTAPSTSPSSSSREENEGTSDDDTASIMSNESWSEETVDQVDQLQYENHLDTDTPMVPTGLVTTTTTAQVNEDGSFFINNNHIIIQRQCQPASTLSLDEATAVLALFEMAKPAKRVAATTYSMV